MKVFISGPMSGKPNSNKEAFFKAQEELMSHGYSVWNPAWFVDHCTVAEFSKDALQAISNEVLRHCDAIYMLKGWRYSEGARNEYKIAEARDLDIMYEEECYYSFRFDLSKAPKKNKPVFDQEFAYDEAVKNRTNYQLEAIKENIKEKYTELKTITRDLRIQCNTVDICLGNESDRINALEGEVEAIKKSIGTDNLQEQLEKDFSDVYEEFQNTKDNVNDINMGYIKWSSEVSQFDERIEKLEENMKEIAANGGLGLSFNIMNERVSSNKRDISSLRNDIDDIHNWINAHDKMLKGQAEQNLNVDRRMDALDASIRKLEESFSEVADDNLSLNAILNKNNDDIARMKFELTENTKVIADLAENNIKNRKLESRVKAIEKKYDELNTAIDINGKDIGTIVQKRCDDNRTINNTLTDLNIRLKAIEKRLSIKPFYAPTEDEKDDD